MGIGAVDIELLIQLRRGGYLKPGSAVIEIGAQQLTDSCLAARDRVSHLGRLFGVNEPVCLPQPMAPPPDDGDGKLDPNAPFARDLWLWLGFEYAAIDIDGSPGSIPLDLNCDTVAPEAAGKYDLVTNFGTTEHVANQLNAFKIVHDLIAPAGIMIHVLPTQGMFNHGLVNYNFKFFWMLARSNGYKFIHADFRPSRQLDGLPDNIVEFLRSNGFEAADRLRDYKAADAEFAVVMQKSFDIAFVPPIDVNTGSSTSIDALKERYWTVFESQAFDRLLSGDAARSHAPRQAALEDSRSLLSRALGKVMNLLRTLRRMVHNSDATVQGIANQSDLINRKLDAVVVGIANQSDLINRKLEALIGIMDELRQIRLDALNRDLQIKPISDIPAPTVDLSAPDDPNALNQDLQIKPISDIPAPTVDLSAPDPIPSIMASQEFAAATNFFADNPAAGRSLVSPNSQALLYCLLRNLRPADVFEIGTYKAGTTEAICRALFANGKGIAHAVDPFMGDHISAVLKHWPPELFRHVRLHTTNSMAFYQAIERQAIQCGLILVDGNHDYEFALFDIASGARAITPGGFIFVDNVAQPGPFFAARDFLSANPGWSELGSTLHNYNPEKAFDRHRTTIVNTDFVVLRAPTTCSLGERPVTIGRGLWWSNKINGVRIKIIAPVLPGTLHIQVVLRGFGSQLVETVGEASMQIKPGMSDVAIPFDPVAHLDGHFVYFTVEPWLIWRGEGMLQFAGAPEVF